MTLKLRQAAIWLGLIVGLAYIGGLHGSYHFDDTHSVEDNFSIRSLSNIPSFWTDPKTSSTIPENRVYRPMVYTLYSICWYIGGGKTWPFHLMKMAMHLLVCLALFFMWRLLWQQPRWFPAGPDLRIKFPFVSHVFDLGPGWVAFFLAALFAIHPANSECVNYISATTSLQCAMFYAWAVCFYMMYRAPAWGWQASLFKWPTGSARYFWLSMLFYFFSVASKEEGITLPAMIAVFEIFFLPRTRPVGDRAYEAVKRMILPTGIIGIVLAAWIFWMHPSEGNESRGWVTPYNYFITQWRAYLWYIRLWFWPWDLNADNAVMEFSRTIRDPAVIQAAIGNAILILLAWFNRVRFPAFLFGLVWYYVTIAPASSVVVLAESVNEHRMYLAYLGFVGGAMTVLVHLAGQCFAPETRTRRLGWLFAAVVVGLAVGSQERLRVWQNDENLWSDTVEKNPTSGRAHNNLALVYMAEARYDKALGHLDKCEQHWKTYVYCPLNKGVALQALGRLKEAEQSYLWAYGLGPRNTGVNFHLARFYAEALKDYTKAIEYYTNAIDLTGGRHPQAAINLALAYVELKKPHDAVKVLRRALGADPANTLALFHLGKIQYDLRDYAPSKATYEKLIAVKPDHLQGWYNFGVLHLARRDFAAARRAFERTVELDAASEMGWYNLAFAAGELKDSRSVLLAMKKLVELKPDNKEYRRRLRELEGGDKR
ncbi:MAG: hypothetical protein A2583_03435 [Bdellovibrionales bacterium RIFOXYD1_FULL_53_11]|nr:MAG: hypothetical protein A2583_03435 [Bdellovibrionales bacterium RIFOXYD1_FULL_53_11]